MASELIPDISTLTQPGFSEIVRPEDTGSTGEGIGPRFNRWFEALLRQSGLSLSANSVLLLCLLTGLVFCGLVYVWQKCFLCSALALVVGGGLPMSLPIAARSRRQRAIRRQLPGLVGKLILAARGGANLEHCLERTARCTPRPLGTELERCLQRMKLGIDLPEALEDLSRRTGVVHVNILVLALAVHYQTGGNLIAVLERLQRTWREDMRFREQQQITSRAARTMAVVMWLLPATILAVHFLGEPGGLQRLLESPGIRWAALAALMLQIIGAFWIMGLLRSRP